MALLRTHSARGLKRLLACLVISLLPLLSAELWKPRQADAQTSRDACGRVAILLAGYNTGSNDVTGIFSSIQSGVLNHIGYANAPIDFSYRYPSPYTYDATYNALPTAAVAALHRTVTAEILRCPGAQIDLIGHSLGGGVALHYLAAYGSSAEGQHIRHVITLDSPVNGTSHDRLVFAAALLNQQRLVGSPTGTYLAAQHRNPNTRALNVNLARGLASHTIVRALESHDDWIVPPDDAEIAGFMREFRLGRDYAACTRGVQAVPSCLGHDRILHDSRALAAIRALLLQQPSNPS